MDRKRNEYAILSASHEMVLIAVETLGPIDCEGHEFLLGLGNRGSTVSSIPREIVHLFQRLSICNQRFHSVAYRGTFRLHPGDEELHTRQHNCYLITYT